MIFVLSLLKFLYHMIFKYVHDSPVGGHLGIYKTIPKIEKEYFWETMRREITECVRRCERCALSKPAQNSHLGKLMSEMPSVPMTKMYICLLYTSRCV